MFFCNTCTNRGTFHGSLASRKWPIACQSRTCGEMTESRMRSSHFVHFRPLGVCLTRRIITSLFRVRLARLPFKVPRFMHSLQKVWCVTRVELAIATRVIAALASLGQQTSHSSQSPTFDPCCTIYYYTCDAYITRAHSN